MNKFNHDFSCILAIFAVSLFTREWIEIAVMVGWRFYAFVSLFTREWIEIHSDAMLNSVLSYVSLFTREWIEIRVPVDAVTKSDVSLFTREWIEMFRASR